MKIINIVGARPNFMKIAPIMRAYADHPEIEPLLIHTGQHYDKQMSDLFFKQLNIPAPDINLGVGSGSHAVQTAEIMKKFEPIVIEHKPDAVLVVGDVNSTIACGLVAVKLGVKLIHVEAGLRSGDRSMPEEINRVLTDSISDLLFVTEQSGIDNLLNEGVDEDKIHFVGNVMIDTLLANKEKADQSTILADLGLSQKKFAVITLHRPSNVDNEDNFYNIIVSLKTIQDDIPVIFPIHPRTRDKLSPRLNSVIEALPNFHLIEPLGYLDFLKLIANARLVLTDSGGLQEETTILHVPCLTLRENTERPVTVELGTNTIVGTDSSRILSAYKNVFAHDYSSASPPPLWDGKAADRIVNVVITGI